MYSSAIANLEKELAELKKDYGRLCQNDSVMRAESSVVFKRIDKQDEEIKELKLLVSNLQQECQRLYQTGFSNGVEVARKEYTDEFKRLEDTGLISCHGFLKSESKEQTLSDLYPTMHCATGSCSGCDEIYLENGMGDLFKYTCKKKNITIISNVTPTPENFAKAFKKE